MASKKNTKKKPQNKENLKQISHLQNDLKHTLRAINGKSKELDGIFADQANRILSQIDKLKENQ